MTMKKIFLSSLLAIAPLSFAQAKKAQPAKVVEESKQEQKEQLPDTATLSKAFGHLIAKNLTDNPGYQFDLKQVITGIQEELEGVPSPLTEAQYEDAIAKIQKQCFDEISCQNLEQANTFLTQNAQKNEIAELVPGKLQMEILQEGSGPSITESSTPLVHYTGRYLDDTVFGTSEKMEPIALDLNDAIAGFKQGLIGAKEGEKRRLYIHPDLGYGDSGFLLPNALMVFDIEVLKSHTEAEKKVEAQPNRENSSL